MHELHECAHELRVGGIGHNAVWIGIRHRAARLMIDDTHVYTTHVIQVYKSQLLIIFAF